MQHNFYFIFWGIILTRKLVEKRNPFIYLEYDYSLPNHKYAG